MREADVAVIGGGPAGYVAAIRAARLGARVLLIEKDALGGTCLNRGCIPTKALLHAVELKRLGAQAAGFGIDFGPPAVDVSRLMARKQEVVKLLVGGVGALMRANKVDVLSGAARLTGARTADVRLADGSVETVSARSIILASGSVPTALPVPGADSSGVIDSDGALSLAEIPQSVVIVGGGVIGAEFACIFRGLDAEVTVIEMMPQLIPTEDADLAAALALFLKGQGVQVFTGAQVQEMRQRDGGVEVLFQAGGEQKSARGDKVLVSVGRRPNTADLGLELAGVRLERGRVVVNERMETGVPGLYAAGDVTGGMLLAHKAMAEGEVAAENAAGMNARMDYRAVPRCLYTLPEIAAVGLTEQQARDEGYEVAAGRFPFSASGRAATAGEREGFVKVVADAGSGELLGVHIAGPQATELIAEAALALRMEATLADIAACVHAHPTLSEALREAALDASGDAIHIPPRRK